MRRRSLALSLNCWLCLSIVPSQPTLQLDPACRCRWGLSPRLKRTKRPFTHSKDSWWMRGELARAEKSLCSKHIFLSKGRSLLGIWGFCLCYIHETPLKTLNSKEHIQQPAKTEKFQSFLILYLWWSSPTYVRRTKAFEIELQYYLIITGITQSIIIYV